MPLDATTKVWVSGPNGASVGNDMPTLAELTAAIAALLPPSEGDISGAWPVGSVFTSVVATNPAALLGFGTWALVASGRTLVGHDAAQVEFDAVRKVGGAKTHVLTVTEMPAHTHVQDAHNHTQNAHAHAGQVASNTVATSGANVARGTGSQGSVTTTNATATNNPATAVNQNTGGGGAHNNLPPYFTVYFWERTA
jgi:microcystin-dependent protein